MSYKEISLAEAVEAIILGKEVYSLHRMLKDASVGDLYESKGFLVKVQDRVDPKLQKKEKQIWPPKKDPKVIDHGKIVACYKAGRTVSWIADETGCSHQTVINHLKKEGIYKNDK